VLRGQEGLLTQVRRGQRALVLLVIGRRHIPPTQAVGGATRRQY
jgi:hypothetical protein